MPDAFAGVDAGAGWRWFSAFGPSCTGYSVPEDPKATLPALTWNPCAIEPFGLGAAACQEWNLSEWSTPGTAVLGGASVSDDGQHLLISRLRESSDTLYDGEDDIYDVATLAPRFGLRFRNPGGAASGQYDACFVIPQVGGRARPYMLTADPYIASLEGDLGQLMYGPALRPLAPAFPWRSGGVDVHASDTTIAFYALTAGPVVRVRRSDMSWVLAKSPGLSLPFTIGDDVLATDQTAGWLRLSRVEPTGDVTVVRQIPSTNVRGLAFDAGYLYWSELSGDASQTGPKPHLEIWRARYTSDIATLNAGAERLAALDGSFSLGFARLYEGVYFAYSGGQTVMLRIADRAVKVLNALPSYVAEPFYYDGTALWTRFFSVPKDAHYGKLTIAW